MAEKPSTDSNQLFGNLDKAQKYPLSQGFEKCLGIHIVRLSKQVSVAGNTVTIPLEPEFQTFSEVELKRFLPDFKAAGQIVEHLHDGPLFLKEQKGKAEADAKKKADSEAKAAKKAEEEAAKKALEEAK